MVSFLWRPYAPKSGLKAWWWWNSIMRLIHLQWSSNWVTILTDWPHVYIARTNQIALGIIVCIYWESTDPSLKPQNGSTMYDNGYELNNPISTIYIVVLLPLNSPPGAPGAPGSHQYNNRKKVTKAYNIYSWWAVNCIKLTYNLQSSQEIIYFQIKWN